MGYPRFWLSLVAEMSLMAEYWNSFKTSSWNQTEYMILRDGSSLESDWTTTGWNLNHVRPIAFQDHGSHCCSVFRDKNNKGVSVEHNNTAPSSIGVCTWRCVTHPLVEYITWQCMCFAVATLLLPTEVNPPAVSTRATDWNGHFNVASQQYQRLQNVQQKWMCHEICLEHIVLYVYEIELY